jgi:4-hydroxy-4-methyl-2-oxoglutarate aldolase
MRFPARSRAVSAQGTVKAGPGSVNVPVVVAGACIRPGDVIVADDDGAVVIPQALVDFVAAEGEEHERYESRVLGLDRYGMRETLERLGVTYVEES